MVRGVLFDKDGTLIDFYDLWEKAALTVIPAFMEENQIPKEDAMEENLLETLGVFEGKADREGSLSYASLGEIAENMQKALEERGICASQSIIQKQITFLFSAYISNEQTSFKPLADLEAVFKSLKAQGIYIGLATADTILSTTNCIEKLGVKEYFDFIGSNDGSMQLKPAPDMLEAFADKMEIMTEEVLVVGDTYNDICFAQQCGSLSAGVLCGISGVEDFYGEADYLLETVAGVGLLCRSINRRAEEKQDTGNIWELGNAIGQTL